MSSQLVDPVPHILAEADDKGHKNSFKPLAAVMNLDLVETATDFHIHADLPGVAKDEINITIENGLITITAHRQNFHEATEDRGKQHVKVHHTERSSGRVQRNIRLPGNADATSARASFKDGVLQLTMPRTDAPAVTVLVH